MTARNAAVAAGPAWEYLTFERGVASAAREFDAHRPAAAASGPLASPPRLPRPDGRASACRGAGRPSGQLGASLMMEMAG